MKDRELMYHFFICELKKLIYANIANQEESQFFISNIKVTPSIYQNQFYLSTLINKNH